MRKNKEKNKELEVLKRVMKQANKNSKTTRVAHFKFLETGQKFYVLTEEQLNFIGIGILIKNE